MALVNPNTGAPGYDIHETSLVAGRLRAITTRSGVGIVHQGAKNGFSESYTKPGAAHFGLTVWTKQPRFAEGGIGTRPAPLAMTRDGISVTPAEFETFLRVPDGDHEIVHVSVGAAQISHALAADDIDGGAPFRLTPRAMVSDPVVHHLVRRFASEAFSGGRGAATLVDGLFLELIVHLLRSYGDVRVPPPSDGGLGDTAASRVASFIEANLSEPIALAELAAITGYSPYHFSRLFKSRFAATPHAYIVRRRLERAAQMLRNRRTSIADIAFACGFSSQQQFTTTFARAFGAPPGRWRQTVLD